MSYLIVSGFNYRTASIDIRERFSLSAAGRKRALSVLRKMPHIEEVFVLSTCNRTEVYAVVSDVLAGFHEIEVFFAELDADKQTAAKPNFKLTHDDVVLHLFRVASGLDSLVLGDAQIISQIKQARQTALEESTLGRILQQLINSAINCGKHVRTHTGIGRLAASVSSSAVAYGKKVLGCLHDKRVVIVGGGNMAQICLKLLVTECAPGKVALVHRSQGNMSAFAKEKAPLNLPGTPSFEERHRLVANADFVIVAASSPDYLLCRDELAELLAGVGKKVLIIDISVPRNVDPAIARLDGVTLLHADELIESFSSSDARESMIDDAARIVFEKLDEFKLWHDSLNAVPTVVALRKRFDAIRREHTSKACERRGNAEPLFGPAMIERFGKAIVNQMLHEPTIRLKASTQFQKGHYEVEAIRKLFGIK